MDSRYILDTEALHALNKCETQYVTFLVCKTLCKLCHWTVFRLQQGCDWSYQVILSRHCVWRSGNFRFFLNERDSEQQGDSPLAVHTSTTAKCTI